MSVMSASTSGHVLIAGAGLGRLALAQGPKKHDIGFSILERDSTPHGWSQGYRIKMFLESVPNLHLLMEPEQFDDFEATTAKTVMAGTAISAFDGRVMARRTLRGPKPYTSDRDFPREVFLLGLESSVPTAWALQRCFRTPSSSLKPSFVQIWPVSESHQDLRKCCALLSCSKYHHSWR